MIDGIFVKKGAGVIVLCSAIPWLEQLAPLLSSGVTLLECLACPDVVRIVTCREPPWLFWPCVWLCCSHWSSLPCTPLCAGGPPCFPAVRQQARLVHAPCPCLLFFVCNVRPRVSCLVPLLPFASFWQRASGVVEEHASPAPMCDPSCGLGTQSCGGHVSSLQRSCGRGTSGAWNCS